MEKGEKAHHGQVRASTELPEQGKVWTLRVEEHFQIH
jgi:hypothetical protein